MCHSNRSIFQRGSDVGTVYMGRGQPNRPLQISRINSRKCEKLTSTGFSGARTRQKHLSPEVVEEIDFFASFVFLLIDRDGKLK